MSGKRNNNNSELGFDFGRQMYLDQRNKTLVCFCNRLKAAPEGRYNEVHGKYSLIQLLMEDYSVSKGAKATFVYYNLEPRDVRTLYHWVSAIYPFNTDKVCNFKLYKCLNDKYWQLDVVHNPKMNNPFGIVVTNGTADKNKKPLGQTGVVKQWYSYELFYSMWNEIYDKLKMWEMIHYSSLCKKMEPITAAAVDKFFSEKENNATEKSDKSKGNYHQQNKNRNNNQPPAKAARPIAPARNELPPLAPPLPMVQEDEIPLEEMHRYKSAYRR